MNDVVLFLSALFHRVLTTSLQASVIVGLILCTSWALRDRISARARHGLWLVLLIKLMVPLLPSSPVSLFNWVPVSVPTSLVSRGNASVVDEWDSRLVEMPVERSEVISGLPGESTRTAAELAPSPVSAPESNGIRGRLSWEWGFVAIWLSGCAVFLFQMLAQNFRFSRFLCQGFPIEDSSVLRLLRTQANAIDLPRLPSVFESSTVSTPAVFGLWKPKIVLPEGMRDELKDEQLGHIFLHELAHLKRRDLWVHWAAHLLRCLHWFNPLIWFAVSQMRRDCEVATDALALRCGEGGCDQAYGETMLLLLRRVGRMSPMPGLMGVVEGKKEMARRIRFIRDFRHRPKLSLVGAIVGVIVALISLTQALPSKSSESNDAITPSVFAALVETEVTKPATVVERGAILCTVLDPDGKLVPQAKYELGTRDWWFIPRGESDEEGQFSVLESQFKPDLVVRASGFAPTLFHWDYDTSKTNRVFQLEKAAEIHGIVVDVDGNPIGEAEVIPSSWYKFRSFDRGLKSGSDGKFVWREAPNHGLVSFTVFAKGYKSVRDFASPVDKALRIQMVRPDHVVGTVVDARTGEAIPSFKFELGQKERADGPVMNIRQRGTGEQGLFELEIREPADAFHLVTVLAEGYAPSISRNFQDGVGRLALRFELEPANDLLLTVLGPDGSPAADATWVQLKKEDHQIWLSSPRTINLKRVRDQSRIGRTDSAGRAQVARVADMTGVVLVHESGFAELDLADLQADSKVPLQAWSRVEGRLLAGPDPIEGATVGLWRIDQGIDQGAALVSLDAVTGLGGRFEFSGLPAGTYQLHREQGTQLARFEVEAGGTATLSIGGRGRTIVGRVELVGPEIEGLNWNREPYYLRTDLSLPPHITSPSL